MGSSEDETGHSPSSNPPALALADSSARDIQEFVERQLGEMPVSRRDRAEVSRATRSSLRGLSGSSAAIVRISVFPDHLEMEFLRSAEVADRGPLELSSFSDWLAALLKQQGLSQEAAARRIGVSLKTVNRWVRGRTEPRLRELRLVHQAFGEAPPLLAAGPSV